jgi:DNA repair exonuclease SbcCD nuclease subunit
MSEGTENQQGQQAEGAQTQPHTPATQAKGIQVKLTQEQIDRLLKDGTLELAEEHFTGAVRERMSTLTARAKAAERRLAEIAAAQEDAERKALEEQERYKELYEKERQAREKEASGRKDDAVRARFLLAAQSKGIVDPDVAFLIAKALPGFTAVQVDDEGKVSGIDEVVEALVKEKPYLVSQPQTQQKPQSVGAASNPAQQSPPPPKNLAEAGDRLEQALRTGVT